jgi:hypothetical protein
MKLVFLAAGIHYSLNSLAILLPFSFIETVKAAPTLTSFENEMKASFDDDIPDTVLVIVQQEKKGKNIIETLQEFKIEKRIAEQIGYFSGCMNWDKSAKTEKNEIRVEIEPKVMKWVSFSCFFYIS